MNVKMSVFLICVEVIMYLLVHNLHDCTFKTLINELKRTSAYVRNFSEKNYLYYIIIIIIIFIH